MREMVTLCSVCMKPMTRSLGIDGEEWRCLPCESVATTTKIATAQAKALGIAPEAVQARPLTVDEADQLRRGSGAGFLATDCSKVMSFNAAELDILRDLWHRTNRAIAPAIRSNETSETLAESYHLLWPEA